MQNRVSFAHPILARNIVFADLPGTYEFLHSKFVPVDILSGLSDTNAHRVRAARLYLRKCDFIFIAHTNTRAADDPAFKNNIKAYHRLKRNGNIAVVITQSDVRTVVLYMRVYIDSTLQTHQQYPLTCCRKLLSRRTTVFLIHSTNRADSVPLTIIISEPNQN